ncbi:MAG: 16S rRNA (guanine(527)-N(7))-methyltransferase RsmG [Oscillospiraceae bacterium]|nr:16S rRNA (guanine(527)-N(7))-methyltransferase RsmG [Oscillospiraceae bacterium]
MRELLCDIFKSLRVEADPARFEKFSEMLLETNKVMNLTAICDPREVCIRHFADSLALLGSYDFSGKRVIDVGCGAGFPGLPLRLARDDISLTLLDSLGKRINFLSGVCESLALSDVECIHARAEEQAVKKGYREGFDIATSRAVADLSVLSELCLPYVKVGGVFLAMKAENCEEELNGAKNAIKTLGGELVKRFDYPLYDTGITHTVLVIEKVRETPAKYPRRFAKIKSNPL